MKLSGEEASSIQNKYQFHLLTIHLLLTLKNVRREVQYSNIPATAVNFSIKKKNATSKLRNTRSTVYL